MITQAKNVIEVSPINIQAAIQYDATASEITQSVSNLPVTNQAQYETAADVLKTIKQMAKVLDEERKKITSPLDATKKAVMDLFRAPTDKLAIAESTIKNRMLTYQTEQERIRREQEEKLQREAEKKQREIEERAKKAEESGKAEKAQELREKAASIVAPQIAPMVNRVAGLSTRETWSAEVTDMMTLVRAVAEGKAPLNFLEANMTVLNAQARATKDSMAFPGVKFNSEKSLASSR